MCVKTKPYQRRAGLTSNTVNSNGASRRLCLFDQAVEDLASDTLFLAGGQNVELAEKPTLQTTLDTQEVNIALNQLDDFIENGIEIGFTIPGAPGLLCVCSHAGLRHVKHEGCIVACGRS